MASNHPDNEPPLLVGIACNRKTDRSSDMQAEFDEPETIEAIENALKSGGFDTVVLEATENFVRKLEAASPDIVFNIAEGTSGRNREAQIPAMLEYYGVPYTGSDAATLAIALDKALTKRIVQSYGVKTPSFFIIENHAPDLPDRVPFPILVKPNAEGSSKGISEAGVAENLTALRLLIDQEMNRHGANLLAEQYIAGREFTVGILGNGTDMRVFEPMEIIFRKLRGPHKIYSYHAKTNFRDYIFYQCPPDIPDVLKTRLTQDAATVYRALGCLDFARIDFRVAMDGTVYFIEANPLPGIAPGYSDFIFLSQYNGMEYDELICHILHCALKRLGMKAVIGHE